MPEDEIRVKCPKCGSISRFTGGVRIKAARIRATQTGVPVECAHCKEQFLMNRESLQDDTAADPEEGSE